MRWRTLPAAAALLLAAACTSAEPAKGGLAWDQSVVSASNDKELTVRFVGARERPATDPCSQQYTLDKVESETSVELTVRTLPRETTGTPAACSLGGDSRFVSVVLDAPVGERRLIDGSTGEEVTAPSS